MTIRTQEWLVFSRRDIAGGHGVVIMDTTFTNEADAKLRIEERVANGEAPAGDEFAARGVIEAQLGRTLIGDMGPFPAFVFFLVQPVTVRP